MHLDMWKIERKIKDMDAYPKIETPPFEVC